MLQHYINRFWQNQDNLDAYFLSWIRMMASEMQLGTDAERIKEVLTLTDAYRMVKLGVKKSND